MASLGCCLLAGCFTPRGADQARRDALSDTQRLAFTTAEVRLNGLYDCNLENEADDVDGGPESAEFNDKHGLLWRMQRGMLSHLLGDVRSSQNHFHDAATLVDLHRSKSLGRAALSAVTNETSKAYDGKGFEHIQVDYYRSLNAVLMAQELGGIYDPAQLTFAPPPASGELAPVPPPPPVDGKADAYYDQAISFARRMVLDQLKFTFDTTSEAWLTTYRFADDPFARLFLSALILASPTRTEGDLQLADAMTKVLPSSYRQHRQTFGADELFRYEVEEPYDLIKRLRFRVERLYDPAAQQERLRGLSAAERAQQEALALPAGHGSVLLVNHVGLITRPEVLDLRFRSGAAVLAGIFSLSKEERERGITVRQVTIGPLQIAAKGPGAEVIDQWHGMIFAPAIMHQMQYLTTVVGFALPVHRSDVPIPPRSVISVDDRVAYPLQVVSDLDTYARATLKDEQVRTFTKTLARVVAKQAAAAIAAAEVEKEHGQGWGLLTRWLGSSVMTLTEIADVRAWFLLPDHIEATLIDLPAGSHTLRLQSPIGEVDLGAVTVPAGRVVIVPVRTLPPKQYY